MATATRSRATKATKADVSEIDLSHLIPSKRYADRYVNRVMEGTELTDFEVLEYAQKAEKNVLTFGDTGPGKSIMFLAYASAYDQPIVVVSGNGGVDPNSFWGTFGPNEQTGLPKWVNSDVTNLIIQGNGVLLIDEFNYMPPKTTGAFNTLLRERFINILDRGNLHIQAGPNLLIAGAYNPDYEGTRRVNKAFKNRWPLKFHIDYDPAVEAQLVVMPVMLEIADKLRDARKKGDLETPTSTNMLIEFEEFYTDLGLAFATANFLNAFEPDEKAAVAKFFEMSQHDLEVQGQEMIDASNG